MPTSAAFVSIALLLILIMAAPLSAAPGVGSPKIHGDASAGYYATSEVYRYAADVNLNFDFGAYKDVKFAFDCGIRTLIKADAGTSFQPDRYRGTLEPSARLKRGKDTYEFFIKHQSFHDIDRFDGLERVLNPSGYTNLLCTRNKH